MARSLGARSPTAVRKIRRVDEMTKALDLRRQGRTLREIATLLECSLGQVHKLITDGIKAVPVESVEALRVVEGERLDADYARLGDVIAAAIRSPTNAAREVVVKATHERTNISAQRAKLFGLNAKEQIDVSGALSLTHDAHDQLLDRLARLAAAAAEGEGGSQPVADRGAGAPALVEGVGEAGADRPGG